MKSHGITHKSLTGFRKELDCVSLKAVLLSGILIFTTIQAQDFPDIEGDVASNRLTFPIYAPEFSRTFTLLIIPAWSILLSWIWDVGTVNKSVYVGVGAYIGIRYYYWRTREADSWSYLIFNVRTMAKNVSQVHYILLRSGWWHRICFLYTRAQAFF